MDMVKHMIPAPIMFSSMAKEWRETGFNPKTVIIAGLGMTDAPASAKRSDATNEAFALRRKEDKGKEVTEEQQDQKNKLKRAMYAYQQGDKSKVNEMLASGELSRRQYDIALTRVPLIAGRPNPKYQDQLAQAFKGLTIEGKLKTWEHMSESEQKKHKGALMKTYFNMRARQDKSPAEKQKAKEEMRAKGLL
jgi:hypothetical protein